MRRTHRFPHLRSNNYPRSPAPARPPSGAMLKTTVSFPLPGKQDGTGPDGMPRAKFRDWLRVLNFPVSAPFSGSHTGPDGGKYEKRICSGPETAALLHLPYPGKTLSSPYGSRGNILKRLSSLWTPFPFRKNNTPEIKNPAPPHGGPGQQNSNSSDYRLADFTIMASLPMRPRR